MTSSSTFQMKADEKIDQITEHPVTFKCAFKQRQNLGNYLRTKIK